MRAALQFKDYHVLETIYKFNPFFSGEDKLEEPKLLFKLDVKPDSLDEAVIVLGIELGDDKLESTPFYIKARIAGVFEIESEGLSEKQIISFYKVNGVTILFPYLRSLVSDLSSKGSESPIIIPTVNVAALIKEMDEGESLNSSRKDLESAE